MLTLSSREHIPPNLPADPAKMAWVLARIRELLVEIRFMNYILSIGLESVVRLWQNGGQTYFSSSRILCADAKTHLKYGVGWVSGT